MCKSFHAYGFIVVKKILVQIGFERNWMLRVIGGLEIMRVFTGNRVGLLHDARHHYNGGCFRKELGRIQGEAPGTFRRMGS